MNEDIHQSVQNVSEDEAARKILARLKSPRRVFWILFITAFCSMLGVGIIVPFLPQYTRHVGADSLFSIGLIFAFMNLSRLIFLPIMRKEAEEGRRSKKIILMEGLAFYIFLSFSYIWSDNIYTLGVVRFFNGFAAAMVIPISLALVGELTPLFGEGREMGDFQFAVMAGFGLGPLLGGVIDDLVGYAAAFAAMGLLNFIALLLVAWKLPATEGRPAITANRREAGKKKQNVYVRALGSRVVFGVMLFRVINSIGRGASFTFIPIIARNPEGLYLSNTEIGVTITSLALIVGVLSTLFGRLADRVSRVKLIVTGSIGFTAAITVMPLCRNFFELLSAAVLSGILGAMAIPASAAMSVVEGRKFGMVTIMTMFQMSMSFGLFIGPPLGGLVGDFIGMAGVFYFAGAINVVGTIIFWILLRKSEANLPARKAVDFLSNSGG